MMKALVRNNSGVTVRECRVPAVEAPDTVLIKVRAAGICRTDISVARGRIQAPDSMVLGHEFSGIVAESGSAVKRFSQGERVVVNPLITCGECEMCQNGHEDFCENLSMLGVKQDGAFAEYIAVPEKFVFSVPETLPFIEAAYVEPVAASLAVTKAGLKKEERGVIYGNNRIAKLTLKVMRACGFENVELFDPENDYVKDSSLDYVIETLATTENIARMVKMLRPQGKLVLKSRQIQPVSINIALLVAKEISMQAVNYAPFEEAVELLSKKEFDLSELIGPTCQLEDYEQVFKEAEAAEFKKYFFEMIH